MFGWMHPNGDGRGRTRGVLKARQHVGTATTTERFAHNARRDERLAEHGYAVGRLAEPCRVCAYDRRIGVKHDVCGWCGKANPVPETTTVGTLAVNDQTHDLTVTKNPGGTWTASGPNEMRDFAKRGYAVRWLKKAYAAPGGGAEVAWNE